MQTAPSDHGVWPWFKKASAKEQPSQIRRFGSKVRERSFVSLREKLLLATVLLVVAGWLIFRTLLTFLTLD